jgi:hypothetical protein
MDQDCTLASQPGFILDWHFHTLTQHSISIMLSEPERHSFTPKAVTRVSSRVHQTPLLPPEAGLNLNMVLTSLVSRALKLVPVPSWVPLCNQNLPTQFARRAAPSPQINRIWWCLARMALLMGWGCWASDKEMKTPHAKSQMNPQKCCSLCSDRDWEGAKAFSKKVN